MPTRGRIFQPTPGRVNPGRISGGQSCAVSGPALRNAMERNDCWASNSGANRVQAWPRTAESGCKNLSHQFESLGERTTVLRHHALPGFAGDLARSGILQVTRHRAGQFGGILHLPAGATF